VAHVRSRVPARDAARRPDREVQQDRRRTLQYQRLPCNSVAQRHKGRFQIGHRKSPWMERKQGLGHGGIPADLDEGKGSVLVLWVAH
jgi:hypothetical protein